jgi:hypothetical protein
MKEEVFKATSPPNTRYMATSHSKTLGKFARKIASEGAIDVTIPMNTVGGHGVVKAHLKLCLL